MSTSVINKSPLARKVRFDEQRFYILLDDERELGIPLDCFQKLRVATFHELNEYRLIGKGEGIHWESLDEIYS
ncbi:DUF2442 domain-containing protein [Mongoliitalea daihaiensis]|uniref:DUF2442 domain-containing protein n=1 Tax=Mongoliitalea daihaiensis TaxID=2782006 RepID=UPI001F1B38DC|nr:DUF2442 domain-containing protein [Mongoliitalea daihaiensis]UJP65672.1 DUF2442 domain-containing protein [Mongoliitalea daihaiensis]